MESGFGLGPAALANKASGILLKHVNQHSVSSKFD